MPSTSSPATRRVFVTVTVRTSSSLNPAASIRSAMSGRPSSTGGFLRWPRSVDSTLFSTPVARMPSSIRSHGAFSVWKVTKQRSRSAPLRASAIWSSIDRSWDGKSGCVITMSRTPRSTAASTTAKISSRDRCPVASSIPWSATTSSTCCSACSTSPSSSTTSTGGASIPRARRSCCSCAQAGRFAPGGGSVRPAVSFAASSVGSHTVRAPSRPAISTASGFSPPTEAFRVMEPRHRTPSGATEPTTCARSAVGA